MASLKPLPRHNESWLQELENRWKLLVKKLEKQFGGDLDLQAILFLIGVQELGKAPKKLNKDQKLELLHIAICTLLEPYGYYHFEGTDEDGYPHWKLNEELPPLKPGHQSALMKEAVLGYFGEEFITEVQLS
jgi:hypothetical protein